MFDHISVLLTVNFGLFPCLLKKEAGVLYGSNLKHGDRFVPVEGTSPTDSFPTDWGFGIALPKSACCSRRRPPRAKGELPLCRGHAPPRPAEQTAACGPLQSVRYGPLRFARIRNLHSASPCGDQMSDPAACALRSARLHVGRDRRLQDGGK